MRILLWHKRMEKQLTLIQLSKLTDISKTTLNDIENERCSPTMFQMEKIAKALHIRITDLYDSDYK